MTDDTTITPEVRRAAESSRSSCRPRCSGRTSTTPWPSSSAAHSPMSATGLKPVHRRVLYAMYDGGYRPDRGFSKCSRVVGDVMGQYHPHGDTAIYDTLVRLSQPWVMRMPLVSGQGNFGSPGNDRAAAMRYTECKMAPLAMEMVRDIEQDTVDFRPNYDGRSQEPVLLPARFPNLLVNGSAGIAVGMATNIPPHNLREVAAGVQWSLDHPEATPARAARRAARAGQGSRLPDGRADRRHCTASSRHTAPAAARSRCARSSTSRRMHETARASSSPSCRTRSTPTTSRSRSPSSPTRVACRASPTSATTRRRALVSAWSSFSSAMPSPGWCSTTSTSTPSCSRTSAATCSRWSTTCRGP